MEPVQAQPAGAEVKPRPGAEIPSRAGSTPPLRGPGLFRRVAAHPLLPWYAGLLGGILPVLLIGFFYSALADRLDFAGWGLLVAAFYTAALRQGMQAGWPAPRLAGALALLLAAGAGTFAWLERIHHEILDLGYRAVLPQEVYFPAATSAGTAAVIAALLAAAGLALLGRGLLSRRTR